MKTTLTTSVAEVLRVALVAVTASCALVVAGGSQSAAAATGGRPLTPSEVHDVLRAMTNEEVTDVLAAENAVRLPLDGTSPGAAGEVAETGATTAEVGGAADAGDALEVFADEEEAAAASTEAADALIGEFLSGALHVAGRVFVVGSLIFMDSPDYPEDRQGQTGSTSHLSTHTVTNDPTNSDSKHQNTGDSNDDSNTDYGDDGGTAPDDDHAGSGPSNATAIQVGYDEDALNTNNGRGWGNTYGQSEPDPSQMVDADPTSDDPKNSSQITIVAPGQFNCDDLIDNGDGTATDPLTGTTYISSDHDNPCYNGDDDDGDDGGTDGGGSVDNPNGSAATTQGQGQ